MIECSDIVDDPVRWANNVAISRKAIEQMLKAAQHIARYALVEAQVPRRGTERAMPCTGADMGREYIAPDAAQTLVMDDVEASANAQRSVERERENAG